MSSLLSVVFNIELSLVIATVTSFILAFLLFLINVPNTEYSRKLAKTKNTIAMCFLASSVLFYVCLRYSGIDNYEVFSSLMMFVVTAMASTILSFSLTNLLEEGDNDKFYINIAAIAVMSYVLMKGFWMENGWIRTAIIASSIVLFVINCVVHIIVFHRTYVRSLRKIEQYYDEEQDHKIKWIRFCYVIMMLTQMFILVYMLLPHGFMKIWALWYVLFMLYFSANFISFLGSHKLLLDAFAYKTLSGQEIMERIERRKKFKQDRDGAVEQTELTDPQLMRISKFSPEMGQGKAFQGV